jgi:hypothetical protein
VPTIFLFRITSLEVAPNFSAVTEVTVPELAPGCCCLCVPCFWQNHLQDSLLRLSFCWRDGLSVYVHRDSAVCMAQCLLHRLHILTIRLQDCSQRVPESMPPYQLPDSCSFHCWPDMPCQDAISPIWLQSVTFRACKHPIIWAAVFRLSLPIGQQSR